MNRAESRPGRLAATEPLEVNQHLQRNAETEQEQNVLALVREAARPLKVTYGEFLNWPVERVLRESGEVLRVLEGVQEITSRSIDALVALRLRLRQAPAGERYLGRALGVKR